MSYKIPFGVCSCNGTTDTNPVPSVKEYKVLTEQDKIVSLEGNMVAIANGLKLSQTVDLPVVKITDDLVREAQRIEGKMSYILMLSDLYQSSDFVYFGGAPYIGDNYVTYDGIPAVEYSLTLEMKEHKHPAKLYWYEFALSFLNGASDTSTLHLARTVSGKKFTYKLSDYLIDFPDMMSLEEVSWYLTQLVGKGAVQPGQHVIVPLTDRISYSDEYNYSFLYVAVFQPFVTEEEGICINLLNVYGIQLTIGPGLKTIINNIESTGGSAILIFCQKGKCVATQTIPLNLPSDFNINGKATIVISNMVNGYLQFEAPGVLFKPIHGKNIDPDESTGKLIIPVSSVNTGCIELETIKYGNTNIILVSEHLSVSYVSASDFNVAPDDIDDLLDEKNVQTIYGSNYSYEYI